MNVGRRELLFMAAVWATRVKGAITFRVVALPRAGPDTGAIPCHLEFAMKTLHPAPLLRLALGADAIISAGTGVLHLALLSFLTVQTALPHTLLLESGLFMLLYAALLGVLTRAERVPVALVRLVIVGNLGWALGALGLMAWLSPPAMGLLWLAVHT
jgi:hypothetical protein